LFGLFMIKRISVSIAFFRAPLQQLNHRTCRQDKAARQCRRQRSSVPRQRPTLGGDNCRDPRTAARYALPFSHVQPVAAPFQLPGRRRLHARSAGKVARRRYTAYGAGYRRRSASDSQAPVPRPYSRNDTPETDHGGAPQVQACNAPANPPVRLGMNLSPFKTAAKPRRHGA
jgi:hypothetical protein